MGRLTVEKANKNKGIKKAVENTQQECEHPAEVDQVTKVRRVATSKAPPRKLAATAPLKKKSKKTKRKSGPSKPVGKSKGSRPDKRKNPARKNQNSITEMEPGAVQGAQEPISGPAPPPDKVSVGGEFHRLTTIDELSPNDGVSPTDGGSSNVDGNLNPQVFRFSGKWEGFRFFTKEAITAKVHWADEDGITPGGYFICNESRESCPKCAVGEQPQDRCITPAYWIREHQVVLIRFNALGKNNKITPIHRIIRVALKHIDNPVYVMRIRKPDQYSFEGKSGRLTNKSTAMEDAIEEFKGWWAENADSIRIAPKLSWEEILERFPTVAEEVEMHEETALDEFDDEVIEDLDEMEGDVDDG